ncbi:MAG: hypothetical protein GX963_10380 [Bacteroidales bacterium]|nr:hypothetical protein [Bacteroidales bacterium]
MDDNTTAQDLKDDFNEHLADYASTFPNNAGAHNLIFRGKDLGSSVTPKQYAEIQAGTFDDMFIGDYWTINDTKYLIAAFDYWYNTGDEALTNHHITLVPETTMYTHEMNDSNTTDGGYLGSKMYDSGLNQARSKIKSDFSGHVVNHRLHLSNAVSDGMVSAGTWVDSEIELMNEVMVYGTKINGQGTPGTTDYNSNMGKTQLPLFRYRPDLIGIRATWWLRDVVSGSLFASVYSHGYARRGSASHVYGVRPAFSIS